MAMYVVQVMGGRERHVAELINKIKPESIEECFTPSFELMKKRGGEWQRVTDILFPGYLFIVSDDATKAYASCAPYRLSRGSWGAVTMDSLSSRATRWRGSRRLRPREVVWCQ